MKKRCPSCNRGVDKKFNFCPYCGASFKELKEKEDFGFIGKDDFVEEIQQENIPLPLGFNKLINSLIKQLEKQMNSIDFQETNIPNGFKIRISTKTPQKKEIPTKISSPEPKKPISKHKKNLPTINAESKIRRLADRIIYEIKAPGVKLKKDVIITKLASGIEVKAYSKNKCYVKFIPLTVELIRYYIENEKVILELKE